VVIQTAHADRPNDRPADSDWHAAIHLDRVVSDRCWAAGVDRRLERLRSLSRHLTSTDSLIASRRMPRRKRLLY
jgi:hypothetical protein